MGPRRRHVAEVKVTELETVVVIGPKWLARGDR
jgi:hypothetical protein